MGLIDKLGEKLYGTAEQRQEKKRMNLAIKQTHDQAKFEGRIARAKKEGYAEGKGTNRGSSGLGLAPMGLGNISIDPSGGFGGFGGGGSGSRSSSRRHHRSSSRRGETYVLVKKGPGTRHHRRKRERRNDFPF